MTARALANRERSAGAAGRPVARAVLERGLSAHFGRRVRVAALEAEPLRAQSTYPIERLQVTLASGERLPVIFKRLHPGEEPKGHRREVLVYRRLLAGGRFGAPVLYASAYDETRGRYWLFLEDLGEQTLKKSGLDAWLAAVRWLAEMHGTYLGRAAELRALGCLVEHGPAYYQGLASAARRNLALGRAAALPRFDRLMAPFADLVRGLVRLPRTLVHGDVLPRNVLVGPGPRARPIDWEGAAVGVAACDLARLIDGWGPERPLLVETYLREIARHAAVPARAPSLERALKRCRVLNVLWYLGWCVEVCDVPGAVDELLDALEAAWECLRKEGGVG